jgi:hypothetical protein
MCLGLFTLALLPSVPWAQPAKGKNDAGQAKEAAHAALTASIDKHLAARWSANKLKAAAQADDAEFIRRVFLDLVGRIPNILEIKDFLDDDSPNKRALWIDRLLDEPEYNALYAKHFTNFWRDLLVAQSNDQQFQFFVPGLETWIRDRLKNNTPYDKMVREIVTAQPFGGFGGGPGGQAQASLAAFYQANEYKPELLAASTSRLFLGVKIECAQCHKHPFAKWTKNQFWEYAAFFAEIQPNRGINPNAKQLKIPGTDKVVKAKFLNGTEPKFKDGVSARVTLADWMTSADNPYFAKAVVNRMWGYFFGIGLVDPVDEFDDNNPASHPELLNELAKEFVAHKYDLKFLIRAMVNTKAYQLTSQGANATSEEDRLFTRMAVRGLGPEQIFDSVATATEYQEPNNTMGNQFVFDPRFGTPRQKFVARFASQDKRTEKQTSILQALFMMNGDFMTEVTSVEKNKTLKNIIDPAVKSSTEDRIRRLFLVVLSRQPRPQEMTQLVKYVNSGGARKDPQKALSDVYWALLNSAEFMLNH